MSLTSIRPYFRSRLKELGFKEWLEPFDAENIPSTLIDRSFHQRIESIQGIAKQNQAQEMEAIVSIRMAFKGFRHPDSALDEAIKKAEPVIADLISPSNYFGLSPPIGGVFLNQVTFEPFSDELNDNIVIAIAEMSVRINLCVDQ